MVSFTSLFFFKSLLSLLNIASVLCFLFLFFFSGRKVCGILGLPGGSDSKESACNAGDPGLIPGSGRPPGEGKGYPLQYSCLENPMDRGAWQATVHVVTKQLDTTEQLGHHHQGQL